jgi:hypothetical protein
MHLQSPAGLLSLLSISREVASQLLETTPESIKLIHANYIDAAFANIVISSSRPVLLKREARRIFVRRIAQLRRPRFILQSSCVLKI